jgi:DNA-binding NarL/FixJ family response regulator
MKVLLSHQDRQSAEKLRGEIQAGDSTWQVEMATDTEEFQARAATGEYQVVIWELSTPGAAGLRSVRQIRASAPDTVLLVTAFPGVEALAAQAVREGADAYLMQRPGWSDELIAMLGRVEGNGEAASREEPDPEPEGEGAPDEARAFLAASPRPRLVLTPTGRIEACNQAAADFTGFPMGGLLGQSFGDLLLAPACATALLTALSDPAHEMPTPGPGLVTARQEDDEVVAELLVERGAVPSVHGAPVANPGRVGREHPG